MPLTLPVFQQGVRNGFWYCDHCDRIILEIPEIAWDVMNPNLASCPHCHKRTAGWHPPLPKEIKNYEG